MLTSFFGKSKPVHFLIFGGFIVLGLIWTVFIKSDGEIETGFLIKNILIIVAIILSLVLLDFIVSRNQLTKRNAYSIFFLAFFILMVPNIFFHSNIIFANFFLLMALRRVISLRKDTNAEKKIVDTAIWITVASLFYFWSLLFFIPLFIAIIQKPDLNFKHFLIPIIGFIAILIINAAYHVLIYNSFSLYLNWEQPISLDFSRYNSSTILVPATLVLTFLSFTLLFRWQNLVSISLKEKSNFLVFFIIIVATLVMAICSADKDGSELLFLFGPTAILCANYIEGNNNFRIQTPDKSENWFKEILLWMVFIIAIVFLFL